MDLALFISIVIVLFFLGWWIADIAIKLTK